MMVIVRALRPSLRFVWERRAPFAVVAAIVATPLGGAGAGLTGTLLFAIGIWWALAELALRLTRTHRSFSVTASSPRTIVPSPTGTHEFLRPGMALCVVDGDRSSV